MQASISPAALRALSWTTAALIVAALVWAALMVRFAGLGASEERTLQPVLSVWRTAPSPLAAPAIRPRRCGPAPARQSAPIETPAPAAAPLAGALSALRCATLAGRRAHPEACPEAPLFAAERGGRDIAPAPVEGVRTHDGALARTILRAANARAENYARGEAQKYADPREDPLYEKGTDPATAAMRPCPAGTLPRGTGEGLTGRTCQPMR